MCTCVEKITQEEQDLLSVQVGNISETLDSVQVRICIQKSIFLRLILSLNFVVERERENSYSRHGNDV